MNAPLILAAALVAASTPAYWQAIDLSAVSLMDDGSAVIVGFPVQTDCDLAVLGFVGTVPVDYAVVTIGGETFRTQPGSAIRISEDTTIFPMSNAVLAAFKNGSAVHIATDQFDARLNLSGSAAAINAAWQACERSKTTIRPTIQGLAI